MFPTWSEIVAPPKARVLRQFSALCLFVLVAVALRRAWHGQRDLETGAIAAAGLLLGIVGLCYPRAVRWVYTGCMVVAFPVGFVVSNVMVAALFFLVFTPVALMFRVIGRDPLRVRRRTASSHWTALRGRRKGEDYLRQS